jgi:hypothetical protein
MINPLRVLAVLGCASAFGSAISAEPESMEIVIGGGPGAGTYELPSANIYCMHLKNQNTVAASYKDFDASDPKTIGTAAIGVTNPDEAGPKRGSVQVSFAGPEGKASASYSISIPGDSPGPLMLTRDGKSAELAFQGKTKDGVSIRITAKCPALEEL